METVVDVNQVSPFMTTVIQTISAFGFKIIGAILLWFVGNWVIRFGVGLLARAMKRQLMEQTIATYTVNVLSVILKIILVVAILGFFGVETTSFAALLAAAGIAIGAAWSGLLANFAAGVFLILFRPFGVGDFITAGGVTGTVEEIGLFVTSINSMDNVKNIIGNNKIFADNIQNFSSNPYRRVELVAQLDNSVDHNDAIARLKEVLAQIANVETNPAPEVDILEFTLAGPVLAVRPYCHNDYYWQVYFDTNKVIRETFGAAGYPAPETHYHIRQTQST
ncbi:MAG: mechanosensitive ion channel family protein [Snowella sp.]|nr:mechanosensitive ion channel family protein [Snowella sp.]